VGLAPVEHDDLLAAFNKRYASQNRALGLKGKMFAAGTPSDYRDRAVADIRVARPVCVRYANGNG
jgi:hypothetical protein